MAGLGTQEFGISAFGGAVTEMTLDWQFQLNGYMFGPGTDVTVVEWEPGDFGMRVQDQDSPAGDWRVFGIDRISPGAWSFELAIRERTADAALELLAPLRESWEMSARSVSQAVLPLRYRMGGRTRQVYGRPRRFTPVMSDLVFGRIPIVADFALAEPWSYADTEQTLTLTTGATELGTPTSFPLSFPFLWGATAGSPRHGQVTIAGTRPTWLRLVITGPVGTTLTDPYVIVADRVFQLRGVVGAQEQIVVSSLPWEQGVFRGDGTTSSVFLDPTSRLSQLRLPVGEHNVSFGGIDNTGTATCQFAWRDAYTSI